MTTAAINLWGVRIGAVSLAEGERAASFQYDPEFLPSDIQVAPTQMPLRRAPYRFPGLPEDAFQGLPGLLADALPDRWGRALVNAWLAAQGRAPDSLDPVERLCYVGTRGMGALEFSPARELSSDAAGELHVAELVRLASEVLAQREQFVAELAERPDERAMQAILQVGSSAGGARPKAVIAYNQQTGEVRHGQITAGEGFTYWLLKLDGVSQSGDHGLADPEGWGVIEYAYSEMAARAGVTMTECRLLEEGPRRHFMTRRFDRTPGGAKLHAQTLGALAHVSYNDPGIYSYEQALMLMRQLDLDTPQIEQQVRRMIFNVVARNQDDHVKNITLLMDRDGVWSLSPAYDITFADAPGNRWLNSHQMTINGKRDQFTIADLTAVERFAGLPRGRARTILDEVAEVVSQWPEIAERTGVPADRIAAIAGAHRRHLPRG